CAFGGCFPRCTSGGGQCAAYGATCNLSDQVTDHVVVCLPSCEQSPPAGAPTCAANQVCDPYVLQCRSQLATGRDNGEPCASGGDCRGGICLTEATWPGFIGGYCTSNGNTPPPAATGPSTPLPQGNCPQGSAMLPRVDVLPGDATLCLKRCTADDQCRT